MPQIGPPPSLRIEHLEIKGYKGIDALRLDFPKPRMADEPDIFVLGSENGVGKTSVLECCSLLMLAFILNASQSEFRYDNKSALKPVHLLDLLIHASMDSAEIKGLITCGDQEVETEIRLERNGIITPHTSLSLDRNLLPGTVSIDVNGFIETLCGLTANPLLTQQFVMLHSYRKTREGGFHPGVTSNAHLSTGETHFISRSLDPTSIFKRQIIISMISKAGLLENISNSADQEINLNKLNELVSLYIDNGLIGKLQLLDDHSFDIRIKLKDSDASFSFDALSSGQKEIISTLFLIWRYTRNHPGVVMIDEPELHLNAQWHEGIIRNLTRNLPHNQYLIATHSEHVMAAVSMDRRLLLRK